MKKTHIMLITLSMVAVLCNLVLILFDTEADTLISVTLRLPQIRLIMSHYIYSIEELIHVVAAVLLVISVIIISKTTIPLLLSLLTMSIAELLRFIGIVVHYNELRNGIYDYTFNEVLYNFVIMIILSTIAIYVIQRKKHYKLLIWFSVVSTILYIILYFVPVFLFASAINITLVLYYISVFSLFGLIGSYFKKSHGLFSN